MAATRPQTLLMDMFYSLLAPRRRRLLPESPKTIKVPEGPKGLQMLFVGSDQSIRIDTKPLIVNPGHCALLLYL